MNKINTFTPQIRQLEQKIKPNELFYKDPNGQFLILSNGDTISSSGQEVIGREVKKIVTGLISYHGLEASRALFAKDFFVIPAKRLSGEIHGITVSAKLYGGGASCITAKLELVDMVRLDRQALFIETLKKEIEPDDLLVAYEFALQGTQPTYENLLFEKIKNMQLLDETMHMAVLYGSEETIKRYLSESTINTNKFAAYALSLSHHVELCLKSCSANEIALTSLEHSHDKEISFGEIYYQLQKKGFELDISTLTEKQKKALLINSVRAPKNLETGYPDLTKHLPIDMVNTLLKEPSIDLNTVEHALNESLYSLKYHPVNIPSTGPFLAFDNGQVIMTKKLQEMQTHFLNVKETFKTLLTSNAIDKDTYDKSISTQEKSIAKYWSKVEQVKKNNYKDNYETHHLPKIKLLIKKIQESHTKVSPVELVISMSVSEIEALEPSERPEITPYNQDIYKGMFEKKQYICLGPMQQKLLGLLLNENILSPNMINALVEIGTKHQHTDSFGQDFSELYFTLLERPESDIQKAFSIVQKNYEKSAFNLRGYMSVGLDGSATWKENKEHKDLYDKTKSMILSTRQRLIKIHVCLLKKMYDQSIIKEEASLKNDHPENKTNFTLLGLQLGTYQNVTFNDEKKEIKAQNITFKTEYEDHYSFIKTHYTFMNPLCNSTLKLTELAKHVEGTYPTEAIEALRANMIATILTQKKALFN